MAPNSPNALAQDKAIPAKIEFRSSGSETVKKVLIGLAPKFKEASSSFVFSCVADDSIAKIKKGKDTNVAATTAPVVVNGSLSPSQLSSLSPIKPFLPSANNNAVPPATGGSTIGKRTIDLTNFIPLNFALAKTQPSGIPSNRQIPAEHVATIMERPMD